MRGDPPRGQEEWEACEGGFEHAVDLVKYIRQEYGDYFDIGVAGFPEIHTPATQTRPQENQWLKAKVDAGANFIITQMFYDVEIFLDWVKEIRELGINLPVIPGIMLIQNWGGFQRTTSLSNTIVPKHFLDTLEPIKEDDAAVREAGTKLVADMCRRMIENGITGLHFYTMNLEKATRMILSELNLIPEVEHVKTLPWRPALTPTRKEENVRPIFWKNRIRSYLSRTEAWDEFPNGRWGDSRSPAFGELDGYGISLKYTKDDALKLWGAPETLVEVSDLFSRFCLGELKSLPWCDQPVTAETDIIRDQLARINQLGFLTINSQPAVNGASSSDKIFGWGPKNGYCYQKAYLEFFVAPEALDTLIKRIEATPSAAITYYAVNKLGDLRTNVQSDSPNAVTWGVFPGKEIVQPTIVDPISFIAWKDEAFELGAEWARVYPQASKTRTVITNIVDTWYLINMVHNDFHSRDAIFEIFEDVDGVSKLDAANGNATTANAAR